MKLRERERERERGCGCIGKCEFNSCGGGVQRSNW